MKVRLFALGAALAATTFGATINLNTGVASWQVFIPGTGLVAAPVVVPNGSWAPAPSGASWISFGSVQGTACVFGQTPGNGCANTLQNPNGDIWTYVLNIPAANLGATSGVFNFVFGSDNRVNLFVGNSATAQVWNGGSNVNGTGFNPLGCSASPSAVSAGNTQASYNNCTSTVAFNASMLNNDGSLTLTAYNYNDPIVGCPACGNPTGFILAGSILTGNSAVPEPATFGLVTLAGLAGLALRRHKRSA